MKDTYIIPIAWELLKAPYRLSIVEKRLLYLILSKIKTTKEDSESISPEKFYSTSVEEYCQMFDTTRQNAFTVMEQASNSLLDRKVTFSDFNDIKVRSNSFHWISQRVIFNDGVFSVRFTPAIIPYISDLKEKFRAFTIEGISEFKSVYTWKLYDFFSVKDIPFKEDKKYNNPLIKEFKFTVEQLQIILGTPESYSKYSNLKKYILIPSCEELVKLKKLQFEGDYFTEIKRVNKVIGILFRVCFNLNVDLSVGKLKNDNVS